jgi:23S rRNA-intervening sequence protein
MKDFKDLKVWEKAHMLTLQVYEVTRSFPKEEIYGLTSQLRRAAASIAANIVEGCGRRSDGEFTRFLQIARVSKRTRIPPPAGSRPQPGQRICLRQFELKGCRGRTYPHWSG